MTAQKRRDLTIVTFSKNSGDCIVISCDSCGSVGFKENDVLKLSPYYTGKFTARVALTEVLCSGAVPMTIINGVSNELKPTGVKIIEGIKDELTLAGLDDIVLTGSTEENFITSMTALSVTVIGAGNSKNLRFTDASAGDKIILFGNPVMGEDVDLQSKGFYTEIKSLLSMRGVKEIVPAGSKGILYEAELLANLSCRKFIPYIDYERICKSAGPATSLVCLCEPQIVGDILLRFEKTNIFGEIL